MDKSEAEINVWRLIFWTAARDQEQVQEKQSISQVGNERINSLNSLIKALWLKIRHLHLLTIAHVTNLFPGSLFSSFRRKENWGPQGEKKNL